MYVCKLFQMINVELKGFNYHRCHMNILVLPIFILSQQFKRFMYQFLYFNQFDQLTLIFPRVVTNPNIFSQQVQKIQRKFFLLFESSPFLKIMRQKRQRPEFCGIYNDHIHFSSSIPYENLSILPILTFHHNLNDSCTNCLKSTNINGVDRRSI